MDSHDHDTGMADTPPQQPNYKQQENGYTPSRRDVLKAAGSAGILGAVGPGIAAADDDRDTLDLHIFTSDRLYNDAKADPNAADPYHAARLSQLNNEQLSLPQVAEHADDYLEPEPEVQVREEPLHLDFEPYGIVVRLLEFDQMLDDMDEKGTYANQLLDAAFGDSTVGVAFLDERSDVGGRGTNSCVTDYAHHMHNLPADAPIEEAPIVVNDEFVDDWMGYFSLHASQHEPGHNLMMQHMEGDSYWAPPLARDANDRVFASVMLSGYAPRVGEDWVNDCEDPMEQVRTENREWLDDLWMDYTFADCAVRNVGEELSDESHDAASISGIRQNNVMPAEDALDMAFEGADGEAWGRVKLDAENPDSSVTIQQAEELRQYAQNAPPVYLYDLQEVPPLWNKMERWIERTA